MIMATRTIPDNPRHWWECTVNGKKYTYKSGETVDVPDAVADVIDAINRANERPAEKPDPVLPKITAADEGKVVKVVGGKYVLADIQDAESEEF
jgi:hypothetical protein